MLSAAILAAVFHSLPWHFSFEFLGYTFGFDVVIRFLAFVGFEPVLPLPHTSRSVAVLVSVLNTRKLTSEAGEDG